MLNDFSVRLKTLRTSKGFSQAGLQRAAGITSSGLMSMYEAGKFTPNDITMGKLAAALGVTVAELSGDAPMPDAGPVPAPKPVDKSPCQPNHTKEAILSTAAPVKPANPNERLIVRCEIEFASNELGVAWGFYKAQKKKGSWRMVEFVAEAVSDKNL
jgi:transcriptional regulator with XRE-family HTH domain